MLTYISTNNMNELNEQINRGAKSVCEKIRVPLKSSKKKSKPGSKIRLETQKKCTKTGQNDKTKVKHWTFSD